MNVTIIKWLLESGGERKTERKRGMRGTKMSTFKEKRKKKGGESEGKTNKQKKRQRVEGARRMGNRWTGACRRRGR